jgi:hypothetical protein
VTADADHRLARRRRRSPATLPDGSGWAGGADQSTAVLPAGGDGQR